MSSQQSFIKLPKARGEWAELRFMARAAEHGLIVTKPWGESSHYDFIVESDGCFVRVQVKSTTNKRNRSYSVMLRGGRTVYTKNDFDVLAAYIIPLEVWFIIPIDVAVTGRRKLHLCPEYPKSIYEPYREAWHLLKQKRCAGNVHDRDLCFRHGCQNRLREQSTTDKPGP